MRTLTPIIATERNQLGKKAFRPVAAHREVGRVSRKIKIPTPRHVKVSHMMLFFNVLKI